MTTPDAERMDASPRDAHGRVVVLRALGIVLAVLVTYACWRGYRSPDFLLGVGAAFGLC
jgi:hypothetical protein